MSIVWRIQHHQWRDFVYPDGRSVKVLVVPMRDILNADSRTIKRTRKKINCNLANQIEQAIRTLGPSTIPMISEHIGQKKSRVKDSLLWNWRKFDRAGRVGRFSLWVIKEQS